MPNVSSAEVSIFNRMVKHMHNRESDPLRPLIDMYYMKRNRAEERVAEITLPLTSRVRPGGRISPSNIGGCQRQAVFRFAGVRGRRRVDPDAQAIFDDGDWRHHKWQTMFRDMEKVLGKEVFEVLAIEEKVTIDSLYISGWFDALVKIYGRTYIIDFKGINDAGFTFVMSHDEPHPKHIDQVVTYAKARKVRRVIILYENKNDQRVRSFAMLVSDSLWEGAQTWVRSVVSHLKRKRLPPKDEDCQAGNFVYERCPYAHLCYSHRYDDVSLRRITFRNWEGIEHAWQAGHAAEEG